MALNVSKIQKTQLQNISNLLDQHRFTDVTFLIGPNRVQFDANRVFLSAISPVFEAMLFGRTEESKANSVIPIEDIEPSAFEAVLSYVYCKDTPISMDNVVFIKKICDKYQISSLSKLCDEYVSSNINKDNFLSILDESVKVKVPAYIEDCKMMIKNKFGSNFGEMIYRDSSCYTLRPTFSKLSQNAVRMILSLDYIDIQESVLFDALLQWIDHQITNKKANEKRGLDINWDLLDDEKKYDELEDETEQMRTKLIRSFCPLIRFGLMCGHYFVTEVKPLGILTKDELIDIFSYFHEQTAGCGDFSTTKRMFDPQIFVIDRSTVWVNGWQCDGKRKDAICITPSQDSMLAGIGVFDCKPQCDAVEYKVYEGNNRSGRRNKLMISGKQFMEPYNDHYDELPENLTKIWFSKIIELKCNVKYTIEIKKTSLIEKGNLRSRCIDNGQTEIEINGFKVSFSNAMHSPNGTDSIRGDIPRLYFAT